MGKMGKKKMKPEAKKPNVLSIRGSIEWRDWLHNFCDFLRTSSTADVIDQALAELAKVKGYKKPPPKR